VTSDLARLETALRQNRWVAEILDRFEEIALPDAWLVAGCLAQTVWNLAAGHPAERGIKDLDIVYFDAGDLSASAEQGHEERLRRLFSHVPAKLDVKNEARVHLWYEKRFGYPIAPYISTANAIATFPTTATSIGVRQHGGAFKCCAPFGLDDLLAGIVRPNKRQITEAVYRAKVQRWRAAWPGLRVVPWETAATAT